MDTRDLNMLVDSAGLTVATREAAVPTDRWKDIHHVV